MEIFYTKKFLKELSKLPKSSREKIEIFSFDTLPISSSIDSIPNIKKLQGYENYYRIRFGDYRLGISYINNEITLMRVIHRKEIYRFFP